MFEKKGLVYWALDSNGCKTGVPIKASSIYGKPTLKALEERFTLNEVLRRSCREQLKEVIDQCLIDPVNSAEFQSRLKAQNIDAVFRHSDDGRLYGVTFVDHNLKAVFNGSDLGKQYSANHLSQVFAQTNNSFGAISTKGSTSWRFTSNDISDDNDQYKSNDRSILNALYREEKQDMAALGKLQQKKRRKKRRGHSL